MTKEGIIKAWTTFKAWTFWLTFTALFIFAMYHTPFIDTVHYELENKSYAELLINDLNSVTILKFQLEY